MCALLRSTDVRLLTLIGTGGTGKTRLAVAVAAALLDEFEHGVFFVDLTTAASAADVVPAIARVLGLQDLGNRVLVDRLAQYVSTRRLLLVLDNFEHVLGAGPQIAELLTSCPMLEVLVTSRAALRLRWEQEFPVLPLGVPDPIVKPSAAAFAAVPSVVLFVQRAQSARPDFVLTDQAGGEPATLATARRHVVRGPGLNVLGDVGRLEADYSRAEALYSRSLALLRQHGIATGVPSVLHNLGYVAHHQGDDSRALGLFLEGLEIFVVQGDQRGIAECLVGVAMASLGLGHPGHAARMFGAGEALLESIGSSPWPTNVGDVQQGRAAVSAQMAAEEFAEAWAVGRTIGSRAPGGYVRSWPSPSSPLPPAERTRSTPRSPPASKKSRCCSLAGSPTASWRSAWSSPSKPPRRTSSAFSASWDSTRATR